MYDGSNYEHMDREKERQLYESRIIVGLTNAGIAINHREDFVAFLAMKINRAYAAEHR